LRVDVPKEIIAVGRSAEVQLLADLQTPTQHEALPGEEAVVGGAVNDVVPKELEALTVVAGEDIDIEIGGSAGTGFTAGEIARGGEVCVGAGEDHGDKGRFADRAGNWVADGDRAERVRLGVGGIEGGCEGNEGEEDCKEDRMEIHDFGLGVRIVQAW